MKKHDPSSEWEMSQDFWNEKYKKNPEQVIVNDHILDEQLKDLSPGDALDLGCGTGRNSLKLAQKGWTVLGVDWSERAIQIAVDEAENQNVAARFLVKDIVNWIPEEEFDLVISTYALPGKAKSQKILQNASKALRVGGTFLVAEWDRSMARIWDFDPEELMTHDLLVEYLPGFQIEVAKIVRYHNMFDIDDPRGATTRNVNVALVRAKKISS